MKTRLITLTAFILGIIGFLALCSIAECCTWQAIVLVVLAAGFIAIFRKGIVTNETDEA